MTQATDFITNPLARTVYSREFKSDTVLFSKWEQAFKRAMYDSIKITLPYTEKGLFRPANMKAYSYTVFLEEGENFYFGVKTDSVYEKVFVDIFKWNPLDPGQSNKITGNLPSEKSVTFFVEETGRYKIILQPEISLYSKYSLRAERRPSYTFPVMDKGNKAIQSFWGDPRSGGTRTHKGIDIFAKRGTPVIAAVDGRVSFVGERGLGGKQVWLRDGLLGNSLYYAHLDSIASTFGEKMKTGDTIGFVGNTGNARTTAPHLHFGVYKKFKGAIDPLPFVKKSEVPDDFDLHDSSPLELGIVASDVANLRISHSSKAQKIGELVKGDSITVMGITKNWLHVATEKQKAFLYRTLVR